MEAQLLKAHVKATEIARHVVTYLRPRRLIVVILCAIVSIFLLLRTPSGYQPTSKTQDSLFPPYDPSETKDNIAFINGEPKVRLLIPATTSNEELCKALYSSTVLGYSAPVLINWNKSFTDTHIPGNGSHLGKITGTLKYLELKQGEIDHDLIVIIDGWDTWFQLPPQVLASRYGAINRNLKDLALKRVGARAIEKEGLTQTILFAADKICGPNKYHEGDVLCYAQPESPLPSDLYGPGTDQLDPEKHLPLKFRPRYLNSGFIAGPGSDLRTLFRHAQSRIQTSKHNGSDQHIFNEIYGEQEYQRQVMRYRLQSLGEFMGDFINLFLGWSGPSIIDRKKFHNPMKWMEGHPLEFGIGLDYWTQISQTAVLSEWDGRYLTFDGSHVTDGAESPLNLQISDDILNAPKPFETLPEGTDSISNTSWTDVRLYTNIWTGSIPVSIHMNGFKTMREAIWHDMWYHQGMRELLTARARKANVGAWSDTGEWLSWDQLCKGTEEEVFRDSLGPWEKPSTQT